MIEIEVSDAVLLRARDMAEAMGKIRNSITAGQGNIAGFIGELIVKELLGAEHQSTKDYDLVLSNGETVDVKTKRTSVAPLAHYDCSVAKLSLHQQCDHYAFCRVKNDYTTCWFFGLIPHDRYFEIARFLKKGEVDPANNFTVKSDCYNVAISEIAKEDVSGKERQTS